MITMDYITTALANEVMLIICVVLIIMLLLCVIDLGASFKELDRIEAEEEQEEIEREQREQICRSVRK